MIVSAYAQRERYWQQAMVPHCSGYVLKLEMSWTQLRKPTKVIDNLSKILFAAYSKPYHIPQNYSKQVIGNVTMLVVCVGDITCISWAPKAITVGMCLSVSFLYGHSYL